jgi:hypothetical protein
MFVPNRFRGIAAVSLAVLWVATFGTPSSGQTTQTSAAFTLVTQVTDYDPQGNATSHTKEIRYESASGDWRFVATGANSRVSQTIFIRQRGAFFADNRNKQFVKISDCTIANCWPHAATAKALRADPKFTGTEQVLGLLAYIHKTGQGQSTYFAVELGDVPFKRVTITANGYKRVEEPVSSRLGNQIPKISWVQITHSSMISLFSMRTWSRERLRNLLLSIDQQFASLEAFW